METNLAAETFHRKVGLARLATELDVLVFEGPGHRGEGTLLCTSLHNVQLLKGAMFPPWPAIGGIVHN